MSELTAKTIELGNEWTDYTVEHGWVEFQDWLIERIEALDAEIKRIRNFSAVDDDEIWEVITHWTGEMPKPPPEIVQLRADNARLREAGRWIPVSERLPEVGKRVMVWHSGMIDSGIAWFKYEDERAKQFWVTNEDRSTIWMVDSIYTHWRSLPTPPQSQEDA